jgi:hypothetical protein
MTDYPFTNWETFTVALDEYLSSQHYYKKYPKYVEQHEMGDGIEVKIVEELLKTEDPQEGLNRFVNVVLYTGVYAHNIKDYIPAIIRLFTEAGAKPDVDSLFKLQYPDDDNFEDEVSSYMRRGWFIDVYDKHGFDMRKYYDWSSIDEGKYFEEIDDETDYQEVCFMVLKYYSKCLTNL